MVEFDLNVEVIEAEADLSFQNKLGEYIDRFRRILNSDVYMPGACRRLAERCEALLAHLKLNTLHLPVVHGLEDDFSPVFGLCAQIASFLENTLELSWASRRITNKEDLAAKATAFTHRVDDVSCQVMIQLKLRTSSPRNELQYDNSRRRSGSIDSTDSTMALESDDEIIDTIAYDRAGKPYRPNARREAVRKVGVFIFITAFVLGVLWIVLNKES